MDKKKVTNGIIILIIGIALIIVTQTVSFVHEVTVYAPNPFGGQGMPLRDYEENTILKNILLFGGIGLMVIGGIFIALSYSLTNKVNSNKDQNKNRFCSSCGKNLVNYSGEYCESCGAKLE